MVKKIKPWHEEDDTLYKEIEADVRDYVDYELEKFKGPFQKNNGRPANNNQDTGRNCPRCSGLLKLKEIKKSGSVQLYCKDCGNVCGCGDDGSSPDGVSHVRKTNFITNLYDDER